MVNSVSDSQLVENSANNQPMKNLKRPTSMRTTQIGIFSLLFATFAFILSCSKDKVTQVPIAADCADTISFSNEVLPLFNQNCSTSGCHDAGSAASGYVFTNHTNISATADQALGAMRHDGGFTPMPLGGAKLADSLIQKVECWIAQGKMNN